MSIDELSEVGAPPTDPDPAVLPDDDVASAPVDDRSEDPFTPEPPEPVEVDDEEILEPKTLPVMRTLIDEQERSREYIQRPLSFFSKIELYGLLGRVVKTAITEGMGVADIMDLTKPKDMLSKLLAQDSYELPGADTSPDAEAKGQDLDAEEAAKMLAAFAQVVSQSPQLLYEGYCIALQAPKGHRQWLIDWALPNIDDALGKDILHTFVDQNIGVMEAFFTQELPLIFKRTAQARRRYRDSAGAR